MPTRLTLRSANVATPFTAVRVRVPASVPPNGFAPIPIVTRVAAPTTVLFKESWIATCTAGAIGLPAATGLGGTVKASFAATCLTIAGTAAETESTVAVMAVTPFTTAVATPVAGTTVTTVVSVAFHVATGCAIRLSLASQAVTASWRVALRAPKHSESWGVTVTLAAC